MENQISNQISDEVIQVDLTWDDNKETQLRINMTAEEIINDLGKKYGYDESYYTQCCMKTIGEASFLLGNHKLLNYAFINENSVPKLIGNNWLHAIIKVDFTKFAFYF